MIPGPLKVIKCPSCGMYQQRKTLISGNTIGATFYSDGKRDAPMLPEYPYFIKCPNCNIYFKIISDVIVEESYSPNRDISFVRFLSIAEYQEAIESRLYNGSDDDLLPLRIALWRTFNDITRNGHTIEEKSVYIENCHSILEAISALNIYDDENRLICAELWRNIGDFKQCKKLLKELKKNSYFKKYISAIKAACNAKITYTIRIK